MSIYWLPSVIISHCFVQNYLVVSEFIKNSYKIRNPRAMRKIDVVYNGVDLDRFRPPMDEAEKIQLRREVLEKRDNIPVVTFVGSIDERKGIDIFLEVVSNYARRRIPAYFVIVGDGEMKDLVKRSVEESASDNLVYLGLRSDVENVLKASDIFVAPYRWGEAFGLTLIEAGACGLPVIATNVGAIPEVLGEGEGAVCVPMGDTEAMINELDKLINDPQLRLHKGTLARKRVERLFDVKKTVENTISFFER